MWVCLYVFSHDHSTKAEKYERNSFQTLHTLISTLKVIFYPCINECGTPEGVFEFHIAGVTSRNNVYAWTREPEPCVKY